MNDVTQPFGAVYHVQESREHALSVHLDTYFMFNAPLLYFTAPFLR
jgi:hypothetical protein